MTDPTTCPTCGSPLPADTADGACPKCAQPASSAAAPAAAATDTPGAAAAPSAEPARLSPLAVAGALLGAAGILAIAAGVAIARSLEAGMNSASTTLAFTGMPVVAVLALLAGAIVSVFAWIQIRNSKGALRGLALAVTGTFLPVAVFCLSAPVVYFSGGMPMPGMTPRQKSPRSYFAAESADGKGIKIAPEEERRIDELWQRVQLLPATPTLSDTDGLYSDSDLKVLKTLTPDGLAKDARAGEFGLPLLPRDVLSCPDLEMYSLTRVRFGAPIASNRVAADCRAVARATDGKRVIRFTLTRDSSRSEWYFGPYRVEFE
jgi:hypothetical protein